MLAEPVAIFDHQHRKGTALEGDQVNKEMATCLNNAACAGCADENPGY